MKQVNKKIFNIKTWHFWKSHRCFVCSVVGYMARATIYINIFLFFANTRVIMEFFFPTLTAILSSPTATQFSQSTFFSLRMDSMLLKSASAVPSFHPPDLRAEQRLSLCYHQTNESKQDSIFLCWLVIWPISTKWKESTIHLLGEFRSRDKISFHSDYKAICETFTLCIYFKGTLMPIWKSANIFVFIWT